MSIGFKDDYTTLGVARDVSPEDLKKAFRALARRYHPDVAADKTVAEEKFKEINEAYEVLSDPEKRRKYDRLGARTQGHRDEQAPTGGPGAGWEDDAYAPDSGGPEFHFTGTGFSDFFERYFAGGARSGFPEDFHAEARNEGARSQRGTDFEGDLLVTLEEAMHGTTRPVSLQRIDPHTGAVETHSFQVRLPPGATDGRRIRVPGQGGAGTSGGPAGDLFLRIRHAAHPDFTTRESDVFHELDLAPWEAVLGGEVVVPTLDGALRMRIPAGAENGQKLRVRGRGLPKGKAGGRGDLYVVLSLQIPTSVGAEERALWEKLRDTSSFQPRKKPSV